MNKKREKIHTYSQTSRLENTEELQIHHNHEKFLFLTVLFLFTQRKMNYWWLVTWLDLGCKPRSLTGFPGLVRIFKNVRKDDPTPAYSPVSDGRCLTALAEVLWTQRVQAPMPQISGPNSGNPSNELRPKCKKRQFWAMTVQVISPNGARLRLFATSGVLFVVLKKTSASKETHISSR
jgi:hypothetical protein